MRVFLDANILFSASSIQSRVGQFVHELIVSFDCVSSSYVVGEARRNLERKFPDRVLALESLISRLEFCEDLASLDDIRLREKDMPVLAGAIAANATHLLTGDLRDFGPFLGTCVQGVKVVSILMLSSEILKMPS